jgi:hypothetical protein
MPVYNEARTLRTIVPRVLASPVDLEIELVAVDDGSSDESVDILHKLAADDSRIRVIVQPHNMGKGKAIRTAIEHMTGDIGIVQDADLEYDPEEYPKVLAPILEGKADAVYGSRFAASEERRVLFFWHSMGNKALTALSNMACDLNLTDMETCYKAVRGDILKSLRLTSDRFGIEPEITARLAAWGARIYEVPISYHGRTYAEGKNIGWKDGLQALWLIFKFRFLDTRFSNNSGKATLEGTGPRSLGWPPGRWSSSTATSVRGARGGMRDRQHHRLAAGPQSASRHRHRSLLCVGPGSQVRPPVERHRPGGRPGGPATYVNLTGFDSVFSSNVLEHLDNPDRALAGFYIGSSSPAVTP